MRKLLFIFVFILCFARIASAQNPGENQYPTALDSAKTLIELKDFARTQLSAGVTNAATTIPVSSTASFPASGVLVIDGREIVTYQAKDSISFLQVQRGQQGTPAVAHSSRILVEMRIISLPHNTLSNAIRNLQRKLGYVDSIASAAGKFLLSTGDRQTAWVDHVLDSLTDVTITDAQNGDSIQRIGGVWVNSPAGAGTVTSVGLVLPTTIFDIAGSPITASGDITVTLDNQTANRIFAGPTSGGAAAPTFRALVSDDIPELALGTKTSGNFVASVASAGPITGGAAGSEGATLTINCPTCVLSSMAGTANEIASTGGTAPVFSISPTFDISGKTSTIPFKSGTLAARPGTCVAAKEFYNVTNPVSGGQQLYVCNAAGDGWFLIGDAGGEASGITSLGGQEGATQTFSVIDDTNIDLNIVSGSNDHEFEVLWNGVLAGDRGGTNNGFMSFTGPASTAKLFTLPNASATILTTNDLVAINQGGTAANSASGARSSLGLAIGTDVQAFDSDLAALAANSANGMYARTGAGTGVARTLTGTANQVIISNGDGVSGNPTFSTPQDIATTSTPQFARLGLGAAADANHLLNLALGTITTDKHALDGSATWNAGGVTFTGLKFNATDTASASGSLLIDLQLGGISKFKVDKSGNGTFIGSINVASCTGCGTSAPGGSTTEVQYRGGASTFSGATNFIISNNNPRLVSSPAPGSPANGESWYDSTQKTQALYVEGLKTFRVGAIFAATAAKTTTNTTTPTTMFGTGVGTNTLPANFLVPGRVVRIRFGGIYSSNGAAQTVAFAVKLGATTVFNGSFFATLSTDGNGEPWWAEAIIVCRTVGASGTVTAQMIIHIANDNGTLAMSSWGLGSQMGNITVDTTASKAIDVTSAWGAASTSNIWTTNWSIVEVLN